MRPLTESETKTLFAKLANYLGPNLVHLVDTPEDASLSSSVVTSKRRSPPGCERREWARWSTDELAAGGGTLVARSEASRAARGPAGDSRCTHSTRTGPAVLTLLRLPLVPLPLRHRLVPSSLNLDSAPYSCSADVSHTDNRADQQPHVFRLHRSRVYYVRESILRQAISVPRANLISLGVCLGKFSKTEKFRLHVTALDLLGRYAKHKVSPPRASEGRRSRSRASERFLCARAHLGLHGATRGTVGCTQPRKGPRSTPCAPCERVLTLRPLPPRLLPSSLPPRQPPRVHVGPAHHQSRFGSRATARCLSCMATTL